MKSKGLSTVRILITAMVAVAPAAGFADCASEPANLTANCNFASDLSGWTQFEGTWVYSTNGGAGIGSAEGSTSASPANATLHQCVTGLAGGTSYGVGMAVRLVSTAGTPPQCVVRVNSYSDAACDPLSGLGSSGALGAMTPVTGSFTLISQSYLSPASTASAIFRLECFEGSINEHAFTVRLDDAYFGVGLVPVELMQFTLE